MKIGAIGVVCFMVSFSGNAFCNSFSGKINTIHTNLQSGMVHIYMENKPIFDGGNGCAAYWTGNLMTDQNFKNYVLPLLMTAKATKEEIRIGVSGCEGTYPKIFEVDFSPRQ